MVAYKCDRCGKFFEVHKREKDGFYITSHLGLSNSFYDLCPTCNNELKEWFDIAPRRVESEE